MRVSLHCFAAALAILGSASAQSDDLAAALKTHDNLSLFNTLLAGASQSFQTAVSSQKTNITVLIPTNDAIASYLSKSGITDVSEIQSDDVETFFSYHVMGASLKSKDFEHLGQVTVPTLLKTEEYNNRSVSSTIKEMFGNDATGQVLIATPSKSKRDGSGRVVDLRAGLAQDVGMTAIDGSWGAKDINSFQIICDISVLAPPLSCAKTVRTIKDNRLDALDTALNKTKMWDFINTTPNISCLVPSTEAFKKAGSPQDNLPLADLKASLLAHHLKETTYTNDLRDGMVFNTLNDTLVRVHVKGDDIYFNNAKVIKANVLTNNGVLHILDSVIESTTESDESSSTSSSSSAASSDNAARSLSIGYSGLVGFLAGLALL